MTNAQQYPDLPDDNAAMLDQVRGTLLGSAYLRPRYLLVLRALQRSQTGTASGPVTQALMDVYQDAGALMNLDEAASVLIAGASTAFDLAWEAGRRVAFQA